MKKRTIWALLMMATALLIGAGWQVFNDDVAYDGPVRFSKPVTFLDTATFQGSVITNMNGDVVVTGSISGGSLLTLTNGSNAGTCSILVSVDQNDDAGDLVKLLFGDNGGMAFQTDKASKGTLATKFTIGEAGRLTMVGGATLDNDTSASVLTITETTVAVVGAFDANSVTVDAAAGIDTQAAGTLVVGASTATKVEVADTGVNTDIEGPLIAKEDIQSNELDAETATPLLIGKSTATAVTIGASDITTSVSGPLVAPRFQVTRLDTTSLTLTSAHYGTMICVSNTTAVALTLPANGAASGSWIDVTVHSGSTDDCAPTISAATADTLIGPNDVDLDSVTWGTGHRIGAQARFWSDGSFWHVQNLGGTTMTYTD